MASSRISDPRRLDVAAAAEAGATLAGEWPLAGFLRLAQSTLAGPADGAARWGARCERSLLESAGVQPSLRLAADAEVAVECQRCLQPMRLALQIDRRIFFVEGEDAAASLDAESDDDVLALTPAIDLHSLVEDELLLALPIVPRHEACALPLPAAVAEDELADAGPEHPFAALAALKRGSAPS